jgi:hypothetical protein
VVEKQPMPVLPAPEESDAVQTYARWFIDTMPECIWINRAIPHSVGVSEAMLFGAILIQAGRRVFIWRVCRRNNQTTHFVRDSEFRGREGFRGEN